MLWRSGCPRSIFAQQGASLNRVASRNVKVLVVGNPANTNALICMTNAPDIPRENFTALTRLDQNRATAMVIFWQCTTQGLHSAGCRSRCRDSTSHRLLVMPASAFHIHGQLAKRLHVSPAMVHNVVIWGNHSATQYPGANGFCCAARVVALLVANVACARVADLILQMSALRR